MISAISLTSRMLFSIKKGSLDEAVKFYSMVAYMRKTFYVATWLAVFFFLGSILFGVFSTCCCSGCSPYGRMDRQNSGVIVEKPPYTYELLGATVPHSYGTR
ncbi:Integral membrane protein [Penicillium soppii]|jgi:hypothetical protein|uniref:Integral membrane protein n=1 Tax=Penicillium soppii TaxID=69789 RepID=UPI0025489A6A|nr:Integral membrane protein [Penicillium soppii]KAJ5861794.1 Integral membrane protein [Penicillium soppii]